MNPSGAMPTLTQEGILFTVVVDSVCRDCMVSNDGLHALSDLRSIDDADVDMLDLFHAYEARINGVARRLVVARVAGNPLIMSRATFGAPYTA